MFASITSELFERLEVTQGDSKRDVTRRSSKVHLVAMEIRLPGLVSEWCFFFQQLVD